MRHAILADLHRDPLFLDLRCHACALPFFVRLNPFG